MVLLSNEMQQKWNLNRASILSGQQCFYKYYLWYEAPPFNSYNRLGRIAAIAKNNKMKTYIVSLKFMLQKTKC